MTSWMKRQIYDKAHQYYMTFAKMQTQIVHTNQNANFTSKYQQYLSENIVVLRNDRLCLAVKNLLKIKYLVCFMICHKVTNTLHRT